MFWWVVFIGIAAVLVTIVAIENRRGSKGASSLEDRHLNAQEKRPGGSGWGSGSGFGAG